MADATQTTPRWLRGKATRGPMVGSPTRGWRALPWAPSIWMHWRKWKRMEAAHG